ncbi:MAG: hypothetical protein ACN6QT_04345 [Burkholderia contaminans]|uniref:hypothetical protein n=1 Tax=Burkholderia cepacia complex TaxID=87882 RepID=UPI001B970EFC|nr:MULTISPECIES: hypothetical protein [Burkholderia cepacia complex]MBR7913111.1 hypothetical protein [Burkholderia vietnamiensis]HDR8918319.1 hypothetical protein [Burkholderia vietnamiensis]HDR8976617.1 hypothetical protein [Burkholderia vietnamiensis]HDR9067124.1 hypothetical protein [Burkholderia vietnamiensis]HDR9277494.1 hypothetical protein [Burkholderia vietnamiensis]
MTKKKPYQDLDDLEKLKKQWRKLSGLHHREEWSAVVMRAATAAEIAANLAIRNEFEARSKFDADFVGSMLVWANGLQGKVSRLLKPLYKDSPKAKKLAPLVAVMERINIKRNAVAHAGEFCNVDEADAVIADCRTFVEGLVVLYHPDFQLKEHKFELEN